MHQENLLIEYPFNDPTKEGHEYILRVAKKGQSFIFDSKGYSDKHTAHLTPDERMLHLIHNDGKNEAPFLHPVSMNLDLYCLLLDAKIKMENNPDGGMSEAEEKALDMQVLKFFWEQCAISKKPLKQEV